MTVQTRNQSALKSTRVLGAMNQFRADIMKLKAGLIFHADASPAIATADATNLATSIALANACKAAYNTHCASACNATTGIGVHLAADATNVEDSPNAATGGSSVIGTVTETGDGPAVTFTGTPTDDADLQVFIDLGGERGTATFKWSKDAGSTFVETGKLTAATYLLGSTGITAHFATSSLSAVTQTGTGPVVTVSGTADQKYAGPIRIKVTTGGALGAGAFDWSKDGGSTWEETGVTLAATYVLGTTGITAAFAAGTYILNTTYDFTATGPYVVDTTYDVHVDSGDETSLEVLLNALKGHVNSHFLLAASHAEADGTNEVTAADAVDLATCIDLANDIKAQINAHFAAAFTNEATELIGA